MMGNKHPNLETFTFISRKKYENKSSNVIINYVLPSYHKVAIIKIPKAKRFKVRLSESFAPVTKFSQLPQLVASK